MATWTPACASGRARPRRGRARRRRLERLGLEPRSVIDSIPTSCCRRPVQGAVALQVEEGEDDLVGLLDDPDTRRRVQAERACVARVGGGCLAPVAAHHDGTVLKALVAAEDGSWVERRGGVDPLAVADELLAAATARSR